jgi:hypothetical protein
MGNKSSKKNQKNSARHPISKKSGSIKKNSNEFSENDILLIRSSWKELRKSPDFKIFGLNMMIKLVFFCSIFFKTIHIFFSI